MSEEPAHKRLKKGGAVAPRGLRQGDDDENHDTTTDSNRQQLPADLWATRIGSFLSRPDYFSLSRVNREIHHACKLVPESCSSWPSLRRLETRGIDTTVGICALHCMSNDNQWLFVLPTPAPSRDPVSEIPGIFVWNRQTGPLASSPIKLKNKGWRPKEILLSNDGRHLALSYLNRAKIGIFDIHYTQSSLELKKYRELSLPKPLGYTMHHIFDMAFSSTAADDGDNLLVAAYERSENRSMDIGEKSLIAIWDCSLGTVLQSVEQPLHPNTVILSPSYGIILWKRKHHNIVPHGIYQFWNLEDNGHLELMKTIGSTIALIPSPTSGGEEENL
jgi:hypothetical protein